MTEKTTITPNTEGMIKTKGGSFHKDDFVGSELAGLTIEQVKFIAFELGIDANKYNHLNVGQQRMNLGNRLRSMTAEKDGHSDEVKGLVAGTRETMALIAVGFRDTNEAAAHVAAANKPAKVAKPKKGVKAPEPIDGEGDTPD